MNRHIFVVTRLDHAPNETPQVSVSGSYFDKEQAYENALLLQLQQMIENTSQWPTQAIQRRMDKILKRCHSLPDTYQSKFQYLFSPSDHLFDDLCHVSHHVHDCLPLPSNDTSQHTSITTSNTTTTDTSPVENPMLQKLISTLQTLLNDEEDLANSDGEDDDDEDEEEEDDEDEGEDEDNDEAEEEEAQVDDIDDDSDEDEVNDSDMITSINNNGDEEDEMDGSDDEDNEDDHDDDDDDGLLPDGKNGIEILDDDNDAQLLDGNDNNNIDFLHQQSNNDNDPVTITTTIASDKPLMDELLDNESTNSDDNDSENDPITGENNGDVMTLLSPPHSDQKQPLTDDDGDDIDNLEEDEIDELNDDEDETPNKRRKIDL